MKTRRFSKTTLSQNKCLLAQSDKNKLASSCFSAQDSSVYLMNTQRECNSDILWTVIFCSAYYTILKIACSTSKTIDVYTRDLLRKAIPLVLT